MQILKMSQVPQEWKEVPMLSLKQLEEEWIQSKIDLEQSEMRLEEAIKYRQETEMRLEEAKKFHQDAKNFRQEVESFIRDLEKEGII